MPTYVDPIVIELYKVWQALKETNSQDEIPEIAGLKTQKDFCEKFKGKIGESKLTELNNDIDFMKQVLDMYDKPANVIMRFLETKKKLHKNVIKDTAKAEDIKLELQYSHHWIPTEGQQIQMDVFLSPEKLKQLKSNAEKKIKELKVNDKVNEI